MGLQNLLSPGKLGPLALKHRVVMSAMTRTRNDPDTEAPREINKLYYTQRASDGGLIISEGTYPTPQQKGYIRQPGVFSDAQIEGWKKVTEGVHAKGGYILCQLMHAGRVSHSSLLPENCLPVAPSAVKPAGLVHAKHGKVPYEEPHALEVDEIAGVIQEFAQGAKHAVEAGFDGIELHGGNGYLIQEFLAKKTNLRTDQYGGSVENRARFLLEVIDSTVAAIGAEKVAVKLQPGATASDLVEDEEDCLAQLAYLGPELEKRNLLFVDLSSLNSDPYYKFLGLEKPNFEIDVFRYFRKYYKGTLVINGGIAPDKADEYIADGTADAVAFGVFFVANANLPELLATGQELNSGGWVATLWYGHDPATDERGYIDWPLVQPIVDKVKEMATAVKDVLTVS